MNDQLDKKPNNFKQAALSHIPLDIQQKMMESTNVETTGMGFLEAISKNTPKVSPLPIVPKNEIVPQEQFKTIVVDGKAIKVSINPYEGALTMLLYLLATVWSKDKKIVKVLKQFKEFNFKDANGEILYPKKGKNK